MPIGLGFKTLLNGFSKLYRSLFLLPRVGREGIADVKMFETEQGAEETLGQSAQDPRYTADIDLQDPFDVAEDTERSIPTHSQDANEERDPFRDVNLFKVLPPKAALAD